MATAVHSNSSWNPALRPDSDKEASYLPDGKPTTTVSTAAVPATPTAADPTAPAVPYKTNTQLHNVTPSSPSVLGSLPASIEGDMKSQVPLNITEEPKSEEGTADGRDLEAAALVTKNMGFATRFRDGFKMFCYILAMCLTLGLWGCWSMAP